MTQAISVNATARDNALAEVASMQIQPTGLVEYQSAGKVIVIGSEDAMEFAPRLRQHDLRAEVLLLSGSAEPGEVIIPVGGRSIVIDGHMGAFTITLGEEGTANYEVVKADLVLDLGAEPLFTMTIKPPGYLVADSADETSLFEALNRLTDLVGTFEKPRYFEYDASICAHGGAGQTGCTLCLDACPTNAITSLADMMEVDPYLCQGGGVCAAVCPTSAIRYTYPSVADSLNRVRQVLKHYRLEGGCDPVVCFVSELDAQKIEEWPDSFIPIVIEELASVGMDVWLSALAYGASSVLLVDGGSVPEGLDAILKEQVILTQSILEGMAYETEVVQYCTADELDKLNMHSMPAIKAAGFAGLNDKRQARYYAIDHLAQESKQLADEILLPASSPFGRIEVNDNCTLCMACTSACPTMALHAGNEVPRLVFIEQNCVQCGLCDSACPEQAIQLHPRLLTDSSKRRASVVVNEESPFLCVTCGDAFATQSVITSILGRLSEHAMFQSDRAKRRLMMCEDCRVVDVVQDTDAMGSLQIDIGQDGPIKNK
jgi:ferredoxin